MENQKYEGVRTLNPIKPIKPKNEVKGIVRNLDHLGRIVIPVEIRKVFGIEPGDAIEILATDEGIFLKVDTNRLKKLEDYTDKELLRELELRKQIRAFNE